MRSIDTPNHAIVLLPGPPLLLAAPLAADRFAGLLLDEPAHAAAVLATMRAHAALTQFSPDCVASALGTLIARHGYTPPDRIDDPALDNVVYDPATLADLIHDAPATASMALAQLNDDQRSVQATAHVAWFATFGYVTSRDEILTWWSSLCAPVLS